MSAASIALVFGVIAHAQSLGRVVGVWVYVCEDRDPVPVDDGHRGGAHGPGGRDYLVTGFEPDRAHGADQSAGPGVDRDRVLDTKFLAEFSL